MHSIARHRLSGFTLVELFVVLMIIAILSSLLLPAVQQIREASRRTDCANRLRQQQLAVLGYESGNRSLPPGADFGTYHSWASQILPFLEQASVYQRIDFEQSWDSPENLPSSYADLTLFRCPSSWKEYSGLTDYAGMRGSSYNTTRDLGRNGVLFPLAAREKPIRLASITDGTSHTISISEAVALDESTHGFWASGLNCVGHDNGSINNFAGGRDEIASLHPGGANVALVDGSVRFLNESMSLDAIAALCTRNNGELNLSE